MLFVNENIGGHATVHLHLRSALADQPHVTAEFLDVPPPGLGRKIISAAVPGLARLDLDLQPLRAQLALSEWVRRQLRRRLDGFDAVHLYTQNAGLRSAGLLSGLPTVVSLDATNVTNAYRLPYRRPTRFTPATVRLSQRFERRVHAAATFVVANSTWIADSLRDDYGLPDDRLRVIPAGLTAPSFDDGPAPGTVAEQSRPQLVFVGRQLARKGALRLIDLHQRELAHRCDLVVVTTERVSPARGVTVISDVTPGSDRLWEVLRSAAVFVFPSPIDQAPNAVLEAMAAGLPVVGLRVGAVPEMLAGGCGTVVPPDDDAALVSALDELIDQPAVRARLGAAARRRFLDRYDAAVTTRQLIGVLGEAVARYPIPAARQGPPR